MNKRIVVSAMSALVFALTLAGCPKDNTDSGTPGTDAVPNTDAANTDAANTDAANTDASTGGADVTGYVFEVLDPTAGVNGAMVDLYDVTDTAGATSLANGTTAGTGASMGTVTLTLASVPALVYAKVSPPTGQDTYSYWNYPVTADTMRNLGFYDTAWAIVMASGQVPGMGYASGAVVDCMGNRVAGATVMASSGTRIYVVGITPDPTATMTDASGSYIVLNMDVGAATMDADTVTMATGCTATTASTDLFVRADAPHIAVTLVP